MKYSGEIKRAREVGENGDGGGMYCIYGRGRPAPIHNINCICV